MKSNRAIINLDTGEIIKELAQASLRKIRQICKVFVKLSYF